MRIGDKIVWFTDLHLGLRNNERRHNEECVEFIKWLIQEAHEFGAKISIFGGDWSHHRNSTQTSTLHYSNECFKLLNNNFDTHHQIVGNHDLFFKDKRDFTSVIFAENLNNIHIVNEITDIGDVVLTPWLVEGEYKKIAKKSQPYVMGHFEFPNFLMNAMVAMPDVGHINRDDFKNSRQTVFSGHFHKRQEQTNIHGAKIIYTGNCFPHSFSDAGDDDRGIMLLELGKEPIYKRWPKAPKFRNLTLSQLLENPSRHIDELTTAKVSIDLDISFEEASFIKETMASEFNVRELKLLPNKNHIDSVTNTDHMTFNTVDEIILSQLSAIESATMDKNLLTAIYTAI